MKVYIRGHKPEKGIVGNFIAFYTFGQYKHISMVFEHNDGALQGFQSNAGIGVHFFETETIGAPNADVMEVPITPEQAAKMHFLATGLNGAKYDYLGNYGFIRRAKRENPDRWFCSEVAAWLCEQINYPLLRMAPWRQHPVVLMASYRLIARPDLNV